MKYWRIISLTVGVTFIFVIPVAAKSTLFRATQSGNVTRTEFSKNKVAPEFVESQVIVKYKTSRINIQTKRGEQQVDSFARQRNLAVVSSSPAGNFVVLRDNRKTTARLLRELKSDPNVEYAEPNYLYYLQTVPNDAEYSKLWGMNNTGQTVNGVAGTTDADIDAPEAWDLSTGSNTVTVAVIDTGVGTGHPDLAGNLVAGYDFVNGDSTPEDQNGHGTHVAGTVSAIGNNAVGVAGVNWNVKIMPLRVLGADGSGTTANIVLAVNYAAQNGAHVMNMSLGGTGYSQTFYDAIVAARTAGVLVVVAAGNGGGDGVGDNNDGGTHTYPCDYDPDNIICVAATDQNDALASFSNFGTTSVDVAAPGVNIYSTGFTQELFGYATLPTLTGTKFTKTSGSWLTNTWVGGDKMVMANSVYSNNDDGILTLTSPVDTTAISGNVLLTFYLYADIEDSTLCANDYLSVEVDNNDNNWVEKGYWCGGFWSDFVTADLGAGTSSMRIRFIWHTNGSVAGAQVPAIDYIEISNTNDYQFKDGTSMATPHVAGLAALLKSSKPDFTYLGIRNTILSSVDAKAGLSGKIVTGGRINAFTSLSSVDEVAPTATINYSTTSPTNQNVTATLVPNETIVVTNNGGSASYIFTANGSFDFTFSDLAGNPGVTTTATVANIDKTVPIVTIASFPTIPTNQDVTVTATTNEGTLNSASHTFTANGSFDFVATDAVGNAGTATATVANIDKTAPVITIASYTTTPTNQDITVTATTNEGTLNAASHTFTANGTFDFVATDAAGNATTSTVTITNIDKTAPVITISPYTTTPTRSSVTVIASTNEGTLNSASYTFTANGSYTFVATDSVGNVTNSTVTVTNIDTSKPVIKTILLTKGIYSYKLNGKTIKIQPFGTDYKGVIWARSMEFGVDGKIYVFLNSSAYKKGQIKVFKADGKLLKAYNPYGGFATSGLNATAIVESNKRVYLAVGDAKKGTAVKNYEITAKKFNTLNGLTATTKPGNVQVSFQKLYKTQYGLVTMKQGDKKTLKVWKLDLTKNKFVEDKKISKTKIKI